VLQHQRGQLALELVVALGRSARAAAQHAHLLVLALAAVLGLLAAASLGRAARARVSAAARAWRTQGPWSLPTPRKSQRLW